MNFGMTFRLLLVACVMAAVVWFLEKHVEPTSSAIKTSALVVNIDAETVSHLSIERDSNRVDCVKLEKGWFIERPLKAKVDDAKMERLLSSLELMRRVETITEVERSKRELSLKDYGLDRPRLRISFVDRKTGRNEIAIGRDTTLGKQLYVRVSDSLDIVATASDILAVVPEKIDDLRDRTLLAGNAPQTVRMEIHRQGAGFMQLVQNSGRWMIQQPIVSRADGIRITQMIDRLFSSRIQKFMWDPVIGAAGAEIKSTGLLDKSPAAARMQEYGLGADDAVMRVTVWVAGDEVGRELIFGKPGGTTNNEVYVKLRDADSVFTVSRELLDTFTVSVNDLRDKLLFPAGQARTGYISIKEGDRKLVLSRKADYGWVISEPVPAKADDQVVEDFVQKITRLRAESFIDGTLTNLQLYGLVQPFCTVQLAETEPSGPELKPPAVPAVRGTGPQRVPNMLLFAKPTTNSDFVYAKLDDSDVIVRIADDALKGTIRSPADPLLYRDRKMLALSPETVRRISLVREGREHVVERAANGAWTVVSPSTNLIDQDAIDGILLQAANLRALRIETDNPKNIASFGIEAASPAVTLGLAGTEAIQKTIVTGFRSRTDGVFVTIRGQDVVFVLDNAAIMQLMREPTRPVQTIPLRQPMTNSGGAK